jgi:hypothetical protein
MLCYKTQSVDVYKSIVAFVGDVSASDQFYLLGLHNKAPYRECWMAQSAKP